MISRKSKKVSNEDFHAFMEGGSDTHPPWRNNGTMEQRLLGLSASLLAGGVAELLQLLPGPGQQLTKLSKHVL